MRCDGIQTLLEGVSIGKSWMSLVLFYDKEHCKKGASYRYTVQTMQSRDSVVRTGKGVNVPDCYDLE